MANILTQIGRALVGAGKYIGGFRRVNTNFWQVGGDPEVYAPIESDTAVTKGFSSNTAVYSIVKKYAKKAASIEHYLENRADQTEMENHSLMVLLERPNEKQSQYAFFKSVYAFYKVCGEAFIWLNRGDSLTEVDASGNLVEISEKEYLKKEILEMYVIPSTEIVILPDKEDPFTVAGYQLRNNPAVKFNKADIIHWMDLNLEWDELSRPQMRGMTPLKPGFKTLTADNSFIDSMVRMAQNDGARAIAYNKSLVQPSPVQQTQIENVFGDKVNNKDRKNQVQALQGDWGLLQLGLTSVDMDTLNARNFIYKELCFLLGVPYAFFDSEVTWDNAKARAIEWIFGEIKPDVTELNGELQRMLFPAFNLSDKQARLCSNFDGLPELQEDKAKQAEGLLKLPLTPNEIREAFEYEPINDPIMEEVFMPSSSSSIMAEPELPPNADSNNPDNAYP